MHSEPVFFESQEGFRSWLQANHSTAKELLVGFNKVGSGLGGITYPQALDVALSYGWIDGVRKSLGDLTWMIRFSPRKARSIWSAVNLRRYAELEASGQIEEPGRKIYESRDPANSRKYSFEQAEVRLSEEYEERFRQDGPAWEYFSRQPPSYRKAATWWVISAKAEETRLRRLATLMDCSRRSERLPQLLSTKKPPGSSNP